MPRLDARAAELPYDVLPGLVALPAAEEGAPAPRAWLPSVARLAGRLTAELGSGEGLGSRPWRASQAD